MLTDEELYSLPDDPTEAFFEFDRIAWDRAVSEIKSTNNQSWYYQRRYTSSLIIFHDAHELNILNGFRAAPDDDNLFGNYFRKLRNHLQDEGLKVRLQKVKATKNGIVTVLTLDGSHKEKIRFHIEKIRATLEGVDIPEKKRESLFKKLNAFAAEVDQNRTKVDALMSLALEVSAAVGKVAENLKPVRDLLDPLFGSLGKAKEENEALPPPESRPQIEGPRKRLPPPEGSGSDAAEQ